MVRLMDRDDYEESYGEVVGTCNVHKIQVVDRSCPQCDEEWTCGECDEVRHNDQRVESGMKCMVCAYENKGGE